MDREFELVIEDAEGPICRGWDDWRLETDRPDKPGRPGWYEGVTIHLEDPGLDQEQVARLRGSELFMTRLALGNPRREWPAGEFTVLEPIAPGNTQVSVALNEPVDMEDV